LALGYLGWTIDEFWWSTPRELINAYRGKHKQEERTEREQWERVRWQAAAIISPHAKKGLKIKDLIVFPWEKKPITAERLERLKNL
jgi:hypothetical protein